MSFDPKSEEFGHQKVLETHKFSCWLISNGIMLFEVKGNRVDGGKVEIEAIEKKLCQCSIYRLF